MEGDLPSVLGEPPRFGKGGPDLEIGVERGNRLEELGRDRGTARITLGGRVERRRLAAQDPDGAIGTGGRLAPA